MVMLGGTGEPSSITTLPVTVGAWLRSLIPLPLTEAVVSPGPMPVAAVLACAQAPGAGKTASAGRKNCRAHFIFVSPLLWWNVRQLCHIREPLP